MMGRGLYVKETVEAKEKDFVRALKRVELHLKEHKWLVGDGYVRRQQLEFALKSFRGSRPATSTTSCLNRVSRHEQEFSKKSIISHTHQL